MTENRIKLTGKMSELSLLMRELDVVETNAAEVLERINGIKKKITKAKTEVKKFMIAEGIDNNTEAEISATIGRDYKVTAGNVREFLNDTPYSTEDKQKMFKAMVYDSTITNTKLTKHLEKAEIIQVKEISKKNSPTVKLTVKPAKTSTEPVAV